jgi:hypothetical protein
MIKLQIEGGADPHSIAQLIINTKKELARTDAILPGASSSNRKQVTKFQRFVGWLRQQYK